MRRFEGPLGNSAGGQIVEADVEQAHTGGQGDDVGGAMLGAVFYALARGMQGFGSGGLAVDIRAQHRCQSRVGMVLREPVD